MKPLPLRVRRRKARRWWSRRELDRMLRQVDPALRRPRARWRGILRAYRRQPAEPYEMDFSRYCAFTFDGAVHVLGRVSIEP